MDNIETHEHDVIIIGAGGAGLRAAIEASAQGVSVGMVCKSLLGKAHTVMAEGGVAASLANADDEFLGAYTITGLHGSPSGKTLGTAVELYRTAAAANSISTGRRGGQGAIVEHGVNRSCTERKVWPYWVPWHPK